MDRADHIKAYLAGKLTAPERQRLEERLAQDAAFAKEFDQIRNAYELLRIDRQNAYKDTLHALSKKSYESPSIPRPSRFSLSWYHIAAAALVLLLPIWLLLNRAPDSRSLLEQKFEPYPDVLSVRTSRPSLDSLVEMGMNHYNLQEYGSAIQAFSEFRKKDSHRHEVNFYLAMSYMGQKEAKLALPLLLQIPQGNAFREASDWYLAMAYAWEGQGQEAQKKLRQMSRNPQHSYQEKAQDLLQNFYNVDK